MIEFLFSKTKSRFELILTFSCLVGCFFFRSFIWTFIYIVGSITELIIEERYNIHYKNKHEIN